MYNPLLNTFMTVADTGSFSKAASSLFISKVSVMKQIDSLEEHLGVSLFIRTSRGVTLTEEGKLIYKEAKTMIRLSVQTVAKAKEISKKGRTHRIRIGCSFFRPYDILSAQDFFHSGTELLPVLTNDSSPAIQNSLSDLERPSDQRYLDALMTIELKRKKGCRNKFKSIVTLHPFFAVPCSSSLAERETLSFDDLDRTLPFLLPAEGQSVFHDELRNIIKNKYPKVTIVDFPDTYSADKYNVCLKENYITDILEIFPVIPGIKRIPMNIDLTAAYGIIYPES